MESSDSSLENIIKCLFCSRVYEEPKILPCGNSICIKCIENLSPEINCKYCLKQHSIDSPEDLITNQFLVSLLKTLHEQQKSHSYSMYDNLNEDFQITSNFKKVNINKEMYDKLNDYLTNVKSKINILNTGYEKARRKIELECDRICDDINKAAEDIIDAVEKKKQVMLNDVDSYKNELLIDYKERYETNKQFEKSKNEINLAYNLIKDEYDRLKEAKSPQEYNNMIRNLTEKIEILNTQIADQNTWMMPDPNPSIGIKFLRNNFTFQIPYIGDITYDSVYKIDMISKISFFNNSFQQRLIYLDHLIEANSSLKFIGLISKNKILVLYEKVFGKVISTFAKIVYYNGMVLYEKEILNVGSLVSYHIYEKFIVIAFRKSKNDHIIYLYDISLKFLKDQAVKFEIVSILMNNESIFLISDKKPFVNEYDYELKFKKSFGQKEKETKEFYIRDQILNIRNGKIFVRFENEIKVLCHSSGDLLSKIKFNDLNKSVIYLDNNKEKYLIFNKDKENKIYYYNHKGELLASNKLKSKESFDEFQFSNTGHFAFICNKKNCILVI